MNKWLMMAVLKMQSVEGNVKGVHRHRAPLRTEDHSSSKQYQEKRGGDEKPCYRWQLASWFELELEISGEDILHLVVHINSINQSFSLFAIFYVRKY